QRPGHHHHHRRLQRVDRRHRRHALRQDHRQQEIQAGLVPTHGNAEGDGPMVRRRRHKGMTLIEVLVALLVSTVGLLGALALIATMMGGGTFGPSATEASVLAQSQVEYLVAQPTVTTSSPADGTTTIENTLDAFGNTVATGNYTRTTNWSSVTDA